VQGDFWLAVAAFWPSIAVAFLGARSTRVSHFKDRVDQLEHELRETQEKHKACRQDLNTLRRWAMWAQSNYYIQRGASRPPPLPDFEDEEP